LHVVAHTAELREKIDVLSVLFDWKVFRWFGVFG
jgi:hypothetical protein